MRAKTMNNGTADDLPPKIVGHFLFRAFMAADSHR